MHTAVNHAHRPRVSITLAVVLAFTLGLGQAARADEVALPAGAATETPAAAPVATPARGVSMSKVENQYGQPTERHAAIGNPPITRWDYPGFSVFFEREHVIHSVVR